MNIKYWCINVTLNTKTHVQYLFAVTLTFLSSSNRIKCGNKVHRTISKIFATCNRGFMYTQRVGIFKYRISLKNRKRKIFISLTNYYLWLIHKNKCLKIFIALKRKKFSSLITLKLTPFEDPCNILSKFIS